MVQRLQFLALRNNQFKLTMKKILLVLTILLSVSSGSVYASFPVAGDAQTEQAAELNQTTLDAATLEAMVDELQADEAPLTADQITGTSRFSEDDWITLALWFFLGAFAAHRWYAGKPAGWNILYILTLGGCGIWAIVDLINILTRKF